MSVFTPPTTAREARALAKQGAHVIVYDETRHHVKGVVVQVFDTYGEYVEGQRPRLKGCRCVVPCKSFRCRSRHHDGDRASPWCVGGSEEGFMESCASCWYVEMKRRGKL